VYFIKYTDTPEITVVEILRAVFDVLDNVQLSDNIRIKLSKSFDHFFELALDQT
jgi:hypothetical protein